MLIYLIESTVNKVHLAQPEEMLFQGYRQKEITGARTPWKYSPCKNPEKSELCLTGESFPAHKQELSEVMGNKDGLICSLKAEIALLLAHKQIPASCRLFPSHQVGASCRKQEAQGLGHPQTFLLCLVCLCHLTVMGNEVNHKKMRSHTASTMMRMYPKTLCEGFHFKMALESQSQWQIRHLFGYLQPVVSSVANAYL